MVGLPFKLILKTQDLTPFDHNHSDFNYLLNSYVKEGKVDHQGFIKSKQLFERYLKSLGNVEDQQFEDWTEEQKLSFWINSYNAFTIKAIIDTILLREVGL